MFAGELADIDSGAGTAGHECKIRLSWFEGHREVGIQVKSVAISQLQHLQVLQQHPEAAGQLQQR